jgi:AcrR family transcriptional regulator
MGTRRRSATSSLRPVDADGETRRAHAATPSPNEERVMNAALAAIGRLGLSKVGVRDIAQEAGLSPGTVLYHFRSRLDILIETLRWTQRSYVRDCRVSLFSLPSAWDRITGFVDSYLPQEDRADPSWMLWLEVWNQAATDPAITELQLGPDREILTVLEEIARYGVDTGEFRSDLDPAAFALWYSAMLDGLAVQFTIRSPRASSREQLVALANAVAERHLDPSL